MKLGFSGYLTKAFINSPVTPLILLASLAMGLIALITIPREEEPQISVPMIDIMVSTVGLKAPDAVELVTEPLETIVSGINAVDHTYSQTQDDQVLITARFEVGTDVDDAILRVHEKIRANYSIMPAGIPEPLIIGRGINDVAIMVLNLSVPNDDEGRWTDNALYNLADELRVELSSVKDVGLSYLVGGHADQIRVEPDLEALALYGVTLEQLVGRVAEANRSFPVGRLMAENSSKLVSAGQTITALPEIELLLLTTRDDRPVYVRDVAKVVMGSDQNQARAWSLTKEDDADETWTKRPAVSLAIAKREGANAIIVAESVENWLHEIEHGVIPDDVEITITRNYGESANEKANELLFHLGLATASIVLLITFMIGWREGVVVLIIIPITILLTLFASNMMGYTINRVSLFALIFSIGILVDDAIVVIENISRHWSMGDDRKRINAAIEAVAEVGNPTIVATMTVVVALLPMLFVSGMMGPYMAPIPINASAAMIFSFFVAVIITPWLMMSIVGRSHSNHGAHDETREDFLGKLYRKIATPIIKSRFSAWVFLSVVIVSTVGSISLFAFNAVTVKLLPFDNKSEFQIVIDLPEGSTLEQTERVLAEAADRLIVLPEISAIQIFSGTAAPFNFNGLVRHYFLRSTPELGDLQIALLPKGDRERPSHAIAIEARHLLADLNKPAGTTVRVVEAPPGPPVMATLLAEIYGPNADARREAAEKVRAAFEEIPYIVDIDTNYGDLQPRLRIKLNQERLEFFNVNQSDVYNAIDSLLNGVTVGYSHRGEGRNPVEIVIALPRSEQQWSERLASTPVPANGLPNGRAVVELGDLVSIVEENGSWPIYRRDGRYAEMVMAEMSGEFEAPIYGMSAVSEILEEYAQENGEDKMEFSFYGQPSSDAKASILWDGEWEVTYVTFRDMGMAFAVALLGIYVLVVAQFGSYKLPLIILSPVPLTFIGIMFGHWAFNAAFTATSMIGFIALAGIIVRNSILLVDFIRNDVKPGTTLRQALIEAGAIRFKPIFLTAIAAMIGAAVILFDPIFQGLAISLLFGLLSSTILTVLVIPAIYIVFRDGDAIISAQKE